MRTSYVYIDNGVSSIQRVTENTLSLFTPKTTLLQQNQQLRSKLQELEIVDLYSKALAKENINLRNLFTETPDLAKKSALARIVDYSALPYGTLLINIDGNTRVEKGNLVRFGKWAIGSIVEINNNTALVDLFTTSGANYDVLIGETIGTFIGASNGIGKIMLPRTEEVIVGMPVTLPAHSGLLLGTVEDIKRTEEAALQTLLVRTPSNISSLRFVTVDIK